MPEYEGIAEGVQEYYEESRKPVEKIIRDNNAYFSDLYDVEVIYVLGFSFNPIDIPYIRRIIECNDAPESIRWNVSYYNDEEKDKFQQILTNLGINVTTQVQFHSLSHWQIHK